MEIIVRALTLALIPLAVNGVIVLLRRPRAARKGEVYLPRFVGILGILFFLLCLIPTVITLVQDEPLAVSVFFFIFSLLGVTLLVAYVNCRIWYDEEGFTAKNFFGIKRHFTYDQLTGFRKDRDIHILLGKRKVVVDELSVGRREFIAFVKKEYRRRHDGNALPEVYRAKFDIFNGNVRDASGFIAAFVLVGVAMLAFLAFAVWMTYFETYTEANTLERQVYFWRYATEDDNILLRGSDSQTYMIRSTDEAFNDGKIRVLCEEKATVTVYVKEVTPDHEDDYFLLKAIVRDGEYVLTFDETGRFYRSEVRPAIWAALGCVFIWAMLVAATVIVGRNPKKFSKGVVRLFFKGGYIRD